MRPPSAFDLPDNLKIERKPLRAIFTRSVARDWLSYTRKRFLYMSYIEPMMFFPALAVLAAFGFGALAFDWERQSGMLRLPAVVELYRAAGLQRELDRWARGDKP